MEPTAKRVRVRRVAAAVLILAVVLFGLVYVGVAVATAERLTRPTNRPLSIDPRGISRDVEAWLTRTADGLTLRGWYLPTEKNGT